MFYVIVLLIVQWLIRAMDEVMIRKYKKKELKKHITYQGALTILDDYAIEFLDGHRQPRNVVVTASDADTQRESLVTTKVGMEVVCPHPRNTKDC